MERAGFSLTLSAGFFSVFLLAWQGMNGPSGDWVYGFLAVFWSLLMLLRLMTLTTPARQTEKTNLLAQKIIGSYHDMKEEKAQQTLETSFGGSYFLFTAGIFFFAVWQIYCAAFPAEEQVLAGFMLQFENFFDGAAKPAFSQNLFFVWGQGFMLLLGFLMMGFVLRSHAANTLNTRPAMLILCMYALAGYITFAGLSDAVAVGGLMTARLAGSGSGALPYIMGFAPEGAVLTLFDILIFESGIIGLALLAFTVFVPLGYIALSAQNNRSDKMVIFCGLAPGIILILSLFLPFTPFLAGLIGLCWMAVFLAWGHAETTLKTQA